MAGENNVKTIGFARKITDAEIGILRKQSGDDIEKLVLGTNDNTKDGFNQNLDFACPHIKVQKAATGTGSITVDALSERPIRERSITLKTLDGKSIEVKVYVFKCSECKGEVPRFIPADTTGLTMKDIQEFNASIFEMASIALQTEMTLRVAYDNTLRLEGWTEGAEQREIPTGNGLVEILKKAPQARLGRFTLLQALRNLKDAASIMAKSQGGLGVKRMKMTQGRGLVKKGTSVFESSTGMRRAGVRRKGSQDVEGSMSVKREFNSRFDERDEKENRSSKGSSEGLKLKD